MADEFNPYQEWLGRPEGSQPGNHYDLLGVTVFEKDLVTITKKADFLTSKIRRARPGAHLAQWQQLLDAIQTAKTCLSDETTKAAYDKSLDKKLFSPPAAEPSGAVQMALPPSVKSVNVLSDPSPMAPGAGSQVISMEKIAIATAAAYPEPSPTPIVAPKTPVTAMPPGLGGSSPSLRSGSSASRSPTMGSEAGSSTTDRAAPMAQPFAQNQAPMAQPSGGNYDASPPSAPAQPMATPSQNTSPQYPDPAVNTPMATPAPSCDNNNPAAYPNQAYPNQAYPNQAYPNQAYPNQAYPNQAYPNQAYPNQAYPNQAYPKPGVPEPGVPEPGIPEPGVPEPGVPESGVPESGVPESGVPESGVPESGVPESGVPESGVPESGVPESGVPESGVPESGVCRSSRVCQSGSQSCRPNNCSRLGCRNGRNTGARTIRLCRQPSPRRNRSLCSRRNGNSRTAWWFRRAGRPGSQRRNSCRVGRERRVRFCGPDGQQPSQGKARLVEHVGPLDSAAGPRGHPDRRAGRVQGATSAACRESVGQQRRDCHHQIHGEGSAR